MLRYFIVLIALLLVSCGQNHTLPDTTIPETVMEDTSTDEPVTKEIIIEEPIEEVPVEEIPVYEPIEEVPVEEVAVEEVPIGEPTSETQPMTTLGFPMPKTDGSTSTLPLDVAVHQTLLDVPTENLSWLIHSKTWKSLENLQNGVVDVLFRTPLSQEERDSLSSAGFQWTEEPIAGEGFVFVVNADNPVDTLTREQLRDIYAGKITNWSEVGGEDLPILAYQRNDDSGSQNFMLSFMGDTPLQNAVTELRPTSMGGLLDAIAHFENSRGAIGYSVYSYADGMYADIAKVKYIRVDGVEPTYENMANGTYPLLGYNYAVFDSTLPADAPVRTLVKWIQSAEGQQVLADAGYVPYRPMEGLTMPEGKEAQLYTATGTGADLTAGDVDYSLSLGMVSLTSIEEGKNTLPVLANEALQQTVETYIENEITRLYGISDETIETFFSGRDRENIVWQRQIRLDVTNGYLSILSGVEYFYMVGDIMPKHYYEPAGTVFDLYTGEKLTLSDLFPEDTDFVPMLNEYLADLSVKPYDTWGYHERIRDFKALEKGKFVFTAKEIVFVPGDVFVEGVSLSLDGIFGEMSVSAARDMNGIFRDADVEIHRILRTYGDEDIAEGAIVHTGAGIGKGEDKLYYWVLDKENRALQKIPEAVIDRINEHMRTYATTMYTREKLDTRTAEMGYLVEDVYFYQIDMIAAGLHVSLFGERFFQVTAPNWLYITFTDNSYEGVALADNPYDSDGFHYAWYYSARTGKKLTIDELFLDGWMDVSQVYAMASDACLGNYGEQFAEADVTIWDVQNYGIAGDGKVQVDFADTNGGMFTVMVDRTFVS